ncbi:MAG: hypothetical protein NZ775_01560 [Gammaproteobacteria bacterium]|nr:hypothetical protein [Gammaproteobacteria bacterium]
MSTNEIINKLDNHSDLESLYQNNPPAFNTMLTDAIALKPDSETLKTWQARLKHGADNKTSRTNNKLPLVIIVALLAGFFAKFPVIFSLADDWFYPRFLPIILVTPIILYFVDFKTNSLRNRCLLVGVAFCTLTSWQMPENISSDSITMSQIHMPLLMLSLLGVSFAGIHWRQTSKRIEYLSYLGEVLIITVLIFLGGAVLTGISIGLFDLIGIDISQFYMDYVIIFGLVAAPTVASYVYDYILNRESHFANTLASIFIPLFFITIVAYLVATIYQGKTPYNDREFLIIFNGLLLVTWAMSVFYIIGHNPLKDSMLMNCIHIGLLASTLVVNAIALSAILYRWAELGTTPNRVAVTGANILIFIHLIQITHRHIQNIFLENTQQSIESTIANFLPIYSLWSLVVVVVLPIAFNFS